MAEADAVADDVEPMVMALCECSSCTKARLEHKRHEAAMDAAWVAIRDGSSAGDPVRPADGT